MSLPKMDLILWASTKANLVTFAQNNNLLDGNGDVVPWVDYCWWAGSGKLITTVGTYDGFTELTPPSYLSGFVILLRLFTSKFGGNGAIKAYIQNNGTPGTIAGLNYYEIDSVRMFAPADVLAYLAANNLPGHEWTGGNSFS